MMMIFMLLDNNMDTTHGHDQKIKTMVMLLCWAAYERLYLKEKGMKKMRCCSSHTKNFLKMSWVRLRFFYFMSHEGKKDNKMLNVDFLKCIAVLAFFGCLTRLDYMARKNNVSLPKVVESFVSFNFPFKVHLHN